MKVFCNKCGEFIREAKLVKIENGDMKLIVTHHGADDSMIFPAGWAEENPDFWFLIVNNMVDGQAFVETEPAKEG